MFQICTQCCFRIYESPENQKKKSRSTSRNILFATLLNQKYNIPNIQKYVEIKNILLSARIVEKYFGDENAGSYTSQDIRL
jgi:hypothetical protein